MFKRHVQKSFALMLIFALLANFISFDLSNNMVYATENNTETETSLDQDINSTETLEIKSVDEASPKSSSDELDNGNIDETVEITDENLELEEKLEDEETPVETEEEEPIETEAETEEEVDALEVIDRSSELTDIPEYYFPISASGGPVSTVYSYYAIDSSGNKLELFRIYASINGSEAAFFNSDSNGNPIEPYSALNQTDEKENAFSEGGQASEIRQRLEPNQAEVTSLSFIETNTGTPGWDADDTPGNDSSPSNDIVRSFDMITYTPYFNLRLQNEALARSIYYVEGYLHFEIRIPNVKMNQARFDLESMPWIENGKQYEDGDDVVLTGKYLHKGRPNSPAFPGEGTLPAIVVKVLGSEHGRVIQPILNLWVEGNDLSQAKSTTSKRITVSAMPRYNIKLARSGSVSVLDDFDFSSGNPDAINNDKGTVYGRLYGYGVTVQLYNTEVSKGLKGIELPKGEISFDLNFRTTYVKGGETVEQDITNQYPMLVWDYIQSKYTDINVTMNGVYGRKINHNYNSNYGVFIIPNNKLPDPTTKNIGLLERSAYNGGTWDIRQNGNTLSVNFDDYEFNPDLIFPIMDQGDNQ